MTRKIYNDWWLNGVSSEYKGLDNVEEMKRGGKWKAKGNGSWNRPIRFEWRE